MLRGEIILSPLLYCRVIALASHTSRNHYNKMFQWEGFREARTVMRGSFLPAAAPFEEHGHTYSGLSTVDMYNFSTVED